MPLPTPRPDEDRDEFIERCMGDDALREEFPDQDQRFAVCQTQWEIGSDRASLTHRRARAALRARQDWYRIVAAADGEAEIRIYDEIGWLGVRASEFVRELSQLAARHITVRLNTPGGDVFDGIAIHNALKRHPATVTVHVDSLAASIGSVIAMAGDRIVMARHSTMMIHEPWALVIGNAQDMRKEADVLDRLGDTIASVYAERAGGSVADWRARMAAETWYSDQEAVEAGLADAVEGQPTAENRFDLSVFRHPPEHLLARTRPPDGGPPTKRQIERALRDAGLSASQAKAFVANGWRALDDSARDVAELERLREALTLLRSA